MSTGKSLADYNIKKVCSTSTWGLGLTKCGLGIDNSFDFKTPRRRRGSTLQGCCIRRRPGWSDQAVHPRGHQPRHDLGARPHSLLQRPDPQLGHVPANHGEASPFYARIRKDLPRSRPPILQDLRGKVHYKG